MANFDSPHVISTRIYSKLVLDRKPCKFSELYIKTLRRYWSLSSVKYLGSNGVNEVE